MLRKCLGLIVLLTLALGSPALAQLPTPDPGLYAPDYGTVIAQDTFLRQSLGQPGSAAEAPARKPKRGAKMKPKPEPKPTARQRATLRFGQDQAVTAKVDQVFLEKFAAPGVAPEVVQADLAQLREVAASDIKALGWRPTDLGDIASYCLVVGWAVVNERTKINRKGAAAVRRAVVDELALTKAVRRLSDARQQELAELLLLRTGYYVGWRNDRLAKGDLVQANVMSEQLRTYVTRVYGVDPGRVKLGSRGFKKG